MQNFIYRTQNPKRVVTVSAETRKEADTKFDQMRDAAGLTPDSIIESVGIAPPLNNIVEFPIDDQANSAS